MSVPFKHFESLQLLTALAGLLVVGGAYYMHAPDPAAGGDAFASMSTPHADARAVVRYAPERIRVRAAASSNAEVTFVLTAGDLLWVGRSDRGGWSPVFEPIVRQGPLPVLGWVQASLVSEDRILSDESATALARLFAIPTAFNPTSGLDRHSCTGSPGAGRRCEVDAPGETGYAACRGYAAAMIIQAVPNFRGRGVGQARCGSQEVTAELYMEDSRQRIRIVHSDAGQTIFESYLQDGGG